MHKPTHGPYSFAGTEPIVINGIEHSPGVTFRENSGALVIMAPVQDAEAAPSDRRRIAAVDTIVEVKRGKGWAMTMEDDPEQAANARLFREAWALYDFAMEIAQMDPNAYGMDEIVGKADRIVKTIDGAE